MRRYGVLTALLYDVFSGERPFYRPGRLVAIEALRLTPGASVLVLGCGTGLDLPPLAAATGPSGTIVAVDDRAVMLRTAARRLRRDVGDGSRPALHLVLADLTRPGPLLPPGVGPVDAVLAVNTLSLIPAWRTAWRRGVRAARPGARAAIADIGVPTERSIGMTVWSRVIAAIGGSKLGARPWSVVEEDAEGVAVTAFRHGHVQVRAGTLG